MKQSNSKPFFYFFLFMVTTLLFMNTVSALDEIIEYPYVGYTSLLGDSLINSLNPDVTTETYPVSNPFMSPLVAEINDNDADGKEIVFLDGANLEIYRYNDVDGIELITAVNTLCDTTYGRISNVVIYDIDNDDKPEIIFYCAEYDEGVDKIMYYRMTGDTLTLTTQDKPDTIFIDSWISGCVDRTDGGNDDCMLFASTSTRSTPGTPYQMLRTGFNTTSVGTEYGYGGNAGDYFFTFPRVKTFQAVDYDDDGHQETVLSRIAVNDYANGGMLYIFVANINSALTISLEEDYLYNSDFPDYSEVGNGFAHISGRDTLATAPVFMDISPLEGTEIVYAFKVDGDSDLNSFKIHVLDKTMTLQDSFPTFAEEGYWLSTPITTSTGEDVCVLAESINDDQARILCGNPNSGIFGLFDSGTFEFTRPFDIDTVMDDEYYAWYSSMYTLDSRQVLVQGENWDEFLTPYGIVRVGYSASLVHEAEIDFKFSTYLAKPQTVIGLDYENQSNINLLSFDDANLRYWDDGFTNTYGYIDTSSEETTVNPCLDSVWKLNTSVQVKIKMSDDEENRVCARATLYYGDSNQMNDSFECGNEGSIFIFNFIANETIGSGILLLEGYDEANPTYIQEEEFRFTVNAQGVEFNDCITILDFGGQKGSGGDTGTTGDDDEYNVSEFSPDNALTNAVNEAGDDTGLGGTIVWLIVMFVTGIIIVRTDMHDHHKLISVLMIESLLLIIGTITGFIPGIYLIVLGVILLAGFGLYISKRFFAPNSGGG